jgi:hypothetical protein
MSEVVGIFQSDAIIRTALLEGMSLIRDNPALINGIFRSTTVDTLLNAKLMAEEIENAKNWFLNTEIPVFMTYRIDEVRVPAITIALQESSEAETTHGDIHYVPTEDTDGDWPALTRPFDPVRWAPSSGMMVLPAAAVEDLIIAPGMWIVDRTGGQHQILQDLGDNTVGLQPGTVADFANAIIKGSKPRFVTHVESASYRETYQIGCHVDGEPWKLTYLHSIVKYILLKYKQDLLESRGFERSQLSSTDFQRNSQFEVELVYSRWINITGYVRQVWEKGTTERVDAVASKLIIGGAGTYGPPVFENGEVDQEALDLADNAIGEE